ncbi:MAG: MFS transporter [Candidatus Omnitrophica bacterium]|nr:MFS transporter [Candidatus Omnitrophota bacterium]
MSTATFIFFCFEAAVLSFNVAASAAVIPSIAESFALSQFFVGKIIWLYMIPYGIAALFYGPLVRAFDARRIELICLICFSLANLLAGLSNNIYLLFAARFLMGIFGASVIPLALILIAKHFPVNKRGKFVGIFFAATFVASLLGLFLSGIVPWRWIYLLPAITGMILWLVMFIYLPSFKSDTGKFEINYHKALKNKALVGIFSYIFLISLFYHGVQQWLAVYFSNKYNFNQFVISMLVTLTSFSGIFGEVLGGLFSDSLGRVKTIKLGIWLMIASVFILIVKLPLFIIALIMIIWGLGWTFNHAGLSTVLTDLPSEFLNESASLNSSVRFVAGGIGVVIGGWLLNRNFNFGFLIIGLSLFLLALFTRKLLFVKKES